MNIIFFGSFQHYSTLILEALHTHPEIQVKAVITTPPMPAGRKKELQKTHTHIWAEQHSIPVFTPEALDKHSLAILTSWLNSVEPASHPERPWTDVTDQEVEGFLSVKPPAFFVVAGYGKILPTEWLNYPTLGSLNIHFSLLPKYRGANPAEWAILMDETHTGISLITMNANIDAGDIITQNTLKISPQDNRETLYTKLYSLAASQSPDDILKYYHWLQKKDANCQTSLAPRPQNNSVPPYAHLLKRDDSFIPWSTISKAIDGDLLHTADFASSTLLTEISAHLFEKLNIIPNQQDLISLIERSSRALYGFPGLWTIVPTIKGNKRLKIHSANMYKNQLKLDLVQLEGLSPTPLSHIKNQLNLQGPTL